MANPVGNFMKNWLNTTYEYLQKTGGPTYPAPTPVRSVGIDVSPTGPYSTVEDYPIDYGHVPLPFNANATGIYATTNSQSEADREEAKQNPPPTVFSRKFGILYGDMMNACIADQKHRAVNPNALSACRGLAERGDCSGMNLTTMQKGALGISTPLQEKDKPDDVRLKENDEANLTSQLGEGGQAAWDWMNAFVRAAKEGGDEPPEKPDGVNFQDFGKKVRDLIPGFPEVPGVNTGSAVMIGGGILLLVLVILVLK